MKRKLPQGAALFVLLLGTFSLTACSDANQKGTNHARHMGDYNHSGMMGYNHSSAMGYDRSHMMDYDH